VVDVFSKMLYKRCSAGMIRGLCPKKIPWDVVCLQYADDALLFLEKILG
jgi:hypothetical protein